MHRNEKNKNKTTVVNITIHNVASFYIVFFCSVYFKYELLKNKTHLRVKNGFFFFMLKTTENLRKNGIFLCISDFNKI